MKIEDIRDKPSEELQDDMLNSREELFNLKFQSATEQIENPARIRELRRTVARINTVLRQRELGIGSDQESK